jgi:HEAT repeat protein
MQLRMTLAVAVLACSSYALADDAVDVAKLTKALSGNDVAAAIQAADDLADLGSGAKAAVPALITALGSKDTKLQWHAAAALSEIGPAAKAAVPALTAALKSKNPQVRGYAAHALEEIGEASKPAAKDLEALLMDDDKDVRRAGLDALLGIHLDSKTLVPILKRAIESTDMDPSLIVPALNALAESGDSGIAVLVEELKNEKARYWACLALAEAGPKAKAALPELSKLAESKEPEMRMQAVITLGEIGPDAKAAVPAIVKALDDKQPSVRYAAAYAAGKIGAKDATAKLTKELASEDHFLKMVSSWSLAKINPEDKKQVESTVKLLVESLKDSDKHVRAAAARGLYELHLPPDQTVPVLMGLLADKDPVIRANVVEALASLGEKALPRAIKALENDATQGLAVEVIRRLGPKAAEATPALALELKDPDAAYRREVEFTLAAIGPGAKAAVPALIERLTDEKEDPHVRYTAIYALGKIGPAASAAIDPLRKNFASDDKFLKIASVWALLHIQPEDKPLQVMAIPLLIKALEETDKDLVRQEVSAALGAIGAPAKAAIPMLEKTAQETESPVVRAAAEDALKKIRAAK